MLDYSMICSITIYIAQKGELQLMNPSGQLETFRITLATVLAFATGAPFPPPFGLVPNPSIEFQVNSLYPRANTCSNTLHLPLGRPMPSREQFAYYLAYGILNSAGFGRV